MKEKKNKPKRAWIRTTDPKEDREIRRRRQFWSGRVCRRHGARWRSRWSRGSSPEPPSAKSSAPEHRLCRTSACCRLHRRRHWCWCCFHRQDGDGACRRWQQQNRGEPRFLVARSLKWRTETERNLWPWQTQGWRRKQRDWEKINLWREEKERRVRVTNSKI